MKIMTVLVVLALSLTSCVTNSKYQLLQKGDVNKSDLIKDKVLRTYKLDSFVYKIQNEDLLSVRFESLTPKDFDFFNYSGNGQIGNLANGNFLLIGELVDQNGEIPFPFIGKMKVSGLSVYQVQEKLQKIASQYLDSPVVKVRLLNYRVTFIGEVNSERSITLTNNRTSMLEAIGLAGGLTDLADRENIKLLRQEGSIATIQYLNLLDEKFIESPYYYVHQNDVVIVPALKQRPYRKYFTSNLSVFLSAISILLVIATLNKK